MTDWRPIETAPRDGTHLLLFDDRDRMLIEADIAIGWWQDGEWRDWGDIGCSGLFPYEPTHWMPLQEPPRRARPTTS